MNVNISFEQIEKLRSMANVTYEEAKEILEKYDGDMVKAIVELEKEGKLNSNCNNQQQQTDEDSIFNSIKYWFKKGNENRLIIKDGEDTILNFSINFTILSVIFAFHLAVFGFILIIVLGYKIRFGKKEGNTLDVTEFAKATAQKVKQTVDDFDLDIDSHRKETEVENENKDVKEDEDGFNEITID